MSEFIKINFKVPYEIVGDPQVINTLRRGFEINLSNVRGSLPLMLHANAEGGRLEGLSSTVRQDLEKNNLRCWIHQVAVNNDGTYKKNNQGVLQPDRDSLGILIPVPLSKACREKSIDLWDWFRKYPEDSLAATLLGGPAAYKLSNRVEVGLADASETADFSVRGLSKPGIVRAYFHYYPSFSMHYSDSAEISFEELIE